MKNIYQKYFLPTPSFFFSADLSIITIIQYLLLNLEQKKSQKKVRYSL